MHTHQILLPFSSSLHHSKMLRNYTWALPSWTLSLPVSLQEITYQGPSFLRLCTKPSLAFPLRSLADQRWLWADQRWLWCQQVMTGSNARKPLSQWDASLNKCPPMQALQPLLQRVWVLGEGYMYISGVQYYLCACHMLQIWWCKEFKFQVINFVQNCAILNFKLTNHIWQNCLACQMWFINSHFSIMFCGQPTWNLRYFCSPAVHVLHTTVKPHYFQPFTGYRGHFWVQYRVPR